MAAVMSKNLLSCNFYAKKPQIYSSLSPHQPASVSEVSSHAFSLHKSRPMVVSVSAGRAPAFSSDTRRHCKASIAGRRELWAMPEDGFLQGRALENQRVAKGQCGFRQRGSSNGTRAFAKEDGHVSGKAGREALPKVWRADNEWLAKHGIPTLEIDEPGRLPRLHLNSKLELPLVKLPPSLEWLDLYGEPQVNLRKRLAVSLDPFGEPQVKLRERLAESLDPFGDPQVKLREKLKVSLDPFGEPQVKLREKIAVNLDPFGEPQVKLREQLAATLKPPLSKPPGGHKPLIFHPPGTVETPEEQKEVKKGKRNPFLEGNFAPVEEECPEEIPCHVTGNLPGELRGQFLRNGPNPRFPQDAGAYHWFDGDGMVHSLKFQGLNRPPVYSSKYIRTSGFKEESQLGRGKFWPGVKMEPLGRCLVTAAVRSMRRREIERDVPGVLAVKNTANTGLIRHAGKLFAMWEGGHPYEVDEALETKGPTTFDGRLVSSFSAHPKLDPQTGELIYFGYSLVARPFLSYGVISKEGEMVHQTDIDLPNPIMMHDFAVTEHYSLFLDFPFVFNPRRMMELANGKRQKPFVFDGTARGRIGVLPRFGTARDLRWFSVGPGMVLHVLNAFEQPAETDDTFLNGTLSFAQASATNLYGRGLSPDSSDGAKLTLSARGAGNERLSASRSDGEGPGSGQSDGRNLSASALDGVESPGDGKGRFRRPVIILRAMHYDTFTGLGLADVSGGGAARPEDAYLHEYRLDLETGGVEERRISDISADFPIINASRQGLYNRYGYMSRFVATSPSMCQEFGCNLTPLFDALVKIDFETGAVQTHEFGPGRLGGEAAFVPRAAPVRAPGFEEILDQLPSYLLDFLPPGAFPRPQGDWDLEQPGEVPGDEDEGWLVVHVWDEALRQSEVLVIDAKEFEGPVLARVVLPRRVPYGFHGTFLPEEEAGV